MVLCPVCDGCSARRAYCTVVGDGPLLERLGG